MNDNTTASFMIALDKRTGEELWRVSRDERGNNWSTPVVWQNRIRTEIVTTGSDGVRSYDLDGALLWELKGMSNLTTPSPFVAEGPRLYQLGPAQRRAAAGLRHPPRR